MKITTTLAVAAGLLLAAGSASAGAYNYVKLDGPAFPLLLGTVADDINNAGLATGYYVSAGVHPGDPPQNYFGFTVQADGSNFTSFTRAGYQQTGASGIDDAGNIVGVSVRVFGQGAGFLRTPGGVYTDIDPALGGLPSVYSEAIGINDAGAIVGYFDSNLPASIDLLQQNAHGFILFKGVYTQFDVPSAAGYGTELFDMNSSGVITGSYLDNTYGVPHGFIYSPKSGFSVPGSAFSSAIGGVNEAGDYTYSALSYDPASPIGYGSTSYVVEGGTPIALDIPGATYVEAQGINDHDQITGLYTDGTGIHAFIASPAPEPASWAMMLFGLAGLGAASRLRRMRRA